MRVLMLSWEYPPHLVGGMGQHVVELAPALADHGASIHIVTPLLRGGAEHEQPAANVTVVRVPPPPMDSYDFGAFTRHTNSLIEQLAYRLNPDGCQFDLIHVHDWLPAQAGIALKHAWRIPLVATIHATERGRGQGRLLNAFSEYINHVEWNLTYEAWRIITCSDFMANQVQQYFQTPNDKIDVVPNGVCIRPNPFANEQEAMAFRRLYAADDQPLVFNVGRVVYEKGIHVLLDAWRQVAEQVPEARLLVAGTGPALEQARHHASLAQLTSSVTFAGYIPDIDRERLYHVADLAVFPSLYEPFGIVALEAMAADCPVLVSDTGGLAEVVTSSNGAKVPPADFGSLAQGILHTLATPVAARARAAVAHNEVHDLYDWHRIATMTTEVYEQVLRAWASDRWGRR